MGPGVPAPGTLRFPRSWLAPLASAGPALPATCSAWEGRVLCGAACTRSSSSTTFSGHRRLLLISARPQKNVSLRRSCGAYLRQPRGAGARSLKCPGINSGRRTFVPNVLGRDPRPPLETPKSQGYAPSSSAPAASTGRCVLSAATRPTALWLYERGSSGLGFSKSTGKYANL
jgi:hypothetical protein